jgi:hypothetical protein
VSVDVLEDVVPEDVCEEKVDVDSARERSDRKERFEAGRELDLGRSPIDGLLSKLAPLDEGGGISGLSRVVLAFEAPDSAVAEREDGADKASPRLSVLRKPNP